MQTLFKKLAYLLLTLAIVNTSVQTVYAFSDKCHEMQMAEHQSKDSSHCLSQKMKEPCACKNCNCNACITLQANTDALPQLFLLNQTLLTEIYYEATIKYAYHSHTLLLRPPIS